MKPKYYALIFDAILFIGDINIVKDKCSNIYIRNMLKKNFVPCSTAFWSSKYEKNIEWKKGWSITNKFFISNKVKEVTKYYTVSC